MNDHQETIAGAQVQHGPNSDRVYVMRLGDAAVSTVCDAVETLARSRNYGKVFVKSPVPREEEFLARGYVREALVPGYYRGGTDAVYLGLFLREERAVDTRWERVQSILRESLAKIPEAPTPLEDGQAARVLVEEDLASLAALYRRVFETYPFPIHDPGYLHETMQSHVVYYGVFERDRLVAAASAEMDPDAEAVEMTDFATDPDHTGKGLARHLLARMVDEMPGYGMHTAMTIARALSPGMNSTFARCAFRYGGTLVNNTGICGSIESMNVWHRSLRE